MLSRTNLLHQNQKSRTNLLHQNQKSRTRTGKKKDYSTIQFLISFFIILFILGEVGASDIAHLI